MQFLDNCSFPEIIVLEFSLTNFDENIDIDVE